MTSTSRCIELLTKSNYDTWSLQAQAVLIKCELWDYASGDTKLAATATAEEIFFFKKQDLKARSELLLLMSPAELKQIKGCNTSKEVWDKLKSIHQSTGPARKATLLKQLVLKKMSPQEDVRDHLNHFMDVVGKLEDMDVKINSELLSIMMLYSLPTTFESFRIAIESRDILPSPEDLKIKITEENDARQQGQSEQSSEALYVKQKKKFNNSLTCKNCNKKGHSTEACWSKKKQNSSNNKKPEKNFNVCLTLDNSNIKDGMWCLDSGCTSHMTAEKSMFLNINSTSDTLKLASDKYTTQVKGKGKVVVCKENQDYNLNDALYVPEISTNLMSVSKITDNGFDVLFTKEKAYIMEKKKTVLSAERKNGLYYLDFEQCETANWAPTNENKTMTWHRKLGHINEKDLKMMVDNQMMRGLVLKQVKLDTCETCIKGKMAALPFTSHGRISSEPLEIIHSDVCGPFEVESLAGSRYYVTFVDDYTRYCCIYFIKNKNDVFEKFKEYKSRVEMFLKKKIQNLQSDNGGEYRNKEFDKFLKENGVKRRLTAPYTPQQNGVSERKNRSLMDKARCLMIDSNAPPSLWAEAVNTANYLINRSPAKALNGSTPYEKWVGKTPCGNHLHVFGSKAFFLNKRRKGKLSPKATEGVFMGYAINAKAFRIYVPEKKDVIISRDVKIIEKMHFDKNPAVEYKDFQPEQLDPEAKEQIEIELQEKTIDDNLTFQEPTPSTSDSLQPMQIETELSTTSERPIRERRLPAWTKDYELGAVNSCVNMLISENSNDCLLTFQEAVSGNDKENWEKATQSEMKSLEKNNTWILVDKEEAKGHKVLSNKWVFRIKDDGTYKARLVVRGCEQKGNLDFEEIYSPVVSQSVLKTLLAIAASKNYHFCTFDVKTAFLYGELTDKVYMKVPVGYKTNCDSTNKVCRLKKSLYGLKQAPFTWNKTFTRAMFDLGFKTIKTDRCVFINKDKTIIIAVFVDDGLVIGKDKKEIEHILSKLETKFEIKKNENPKTYLGIEINNCKEGIKLTQKNYINDMLKKYSMENAKPSETPGSNDAKVTQETPQEKEYPYREAVGSLLYLSTRTRPDIAQAVNQVSRKVENPSKEDVTKVKKIFKYLIGTKDKGILFKRNSRIERIDAYTDSDYAGDPLTRRSTSGSVLMIANGPITWGSKRQPIVALSSTEAEYIAAADCCKEAMYLNSLLKEITDLDLKIHLYVDNQSSIQLIKSGSFNKRSKHIDVRYHFIHEQFVKGLVNVNYCPTETQLADIMTKPLSKVKFARHCATLMCG